jgi:hypothetical protein
LTAALSGSSRCVRLTFISEHLSGPFIVSSLPLYSQEQLIF